MGRGANISHQNIEHKPNINFNFFFKTLQP